MDSEAWERQADAAAAAGDMATARTMLARVVEADPEGFTARLKLSALLRAGGDARAALSMLDKALALRPQDFSALLMRATQLHGLGRTEEAGAAYGRALAQAPDQPPPVMAEAIRLAGERHRAWQEGEAGRLRESARRAGPTALSPAIERFITNAVRLTPADREGPSHYCYPGLGEDGYYDRSLFPWIAELEAATDMIEGELRHLLAAREAVSVPYIDYPDHMPLEQWSALNRNRDWSAAHLINRGQRVEDNARHAPGTLALLDRLPQPRIAGAGPNAMFSLLAPHTHIPPHCGVSNTRLVCHLPLIVPPGCWFTVGEERREWRRGEAWLFDDTVEHEAMNPTDALRVVLIFDIWQPAIPETDRPAVAAVIGAGGYIHGL